MAPTLAASRRLARPASGLLAITIRRGAYAARAGRRAFPLPIKPREHARGHAEEIEQHAGEITQAPRNVTFAAVAYAARHRARLQHHELAAFEPAHEIDILHERNRPEAAKLAIKPARDEQSLIAVRQREQKAAERHERFQHTRQRPVIVEGKAEGCRGRCPPTLG